MAMKFLIVRTPRGEAPVVFSPDFMHAHMARQLAPAEVVSAGFVEIADGEITCFGRSEGLHIPSRGARDAEIIAHALEARATKP